MPGGGGMCDWRACMLLGDMHVSQGTFMLPGGHACQVVEGMYNRGGHVCHARPLPRYHEIQSVNERAVRILLEWILVCRKVQS